MIIIKETIYTIPVIEAIEAAGECPFCVMYDALEDNAINFLMGPSVAYMEGDIRMQTNDVGFCKVHYKQLFDCKNRLGLGLMLHTHLKEINRAFDRRIDDAAKQKKPLFKRLDKTELVELTQKLAASCFVCDMIEKSWPRYIETFFLLFEKEAEMREKVAGLSGFCLNHFAMLVEQAPKHLGSKEMSAFFEVIAPMQKAQLVRMEEELDWFVKKFDYRFADEPWKTSKDAVERALTKIASITQKDKKGNI